MAFLHILAHVLLSFSVSSTIAAGRDCPSQIVSLPVKDVALSDFATKRGVPISVGEPPQELSFLPAIELDNIWVFRTNEPVCRLFSEANCLVYRGGTFEESDSTTFRSAQSATDAGSLTDDSQVVPKADWARDSLTLATEDIHGFPIALPLEDLTPHVWSTGNTLGLSSNSTIIEYLKTAGQVGSRVWSLWWGLAGGDDNTRMDGGLVLGGYDEAKIREQKKHTEAFALLEDGSLGLLVTVTELTLNFPNGSDFNLLDPDLLDSSFIPFRICPQWPVVMTLPFDPYFNRFLEWTGSTTLNRNSGLNFFTSNFDVDDVYQGDLTITLDSGFSVRIPNNQLVTPELKLSAGEIDTNTSTQNVLIYPLEKDHRDDMECLGHYFLTAAYLMVDHEAQEFTLWEANPNESTNLVSVSGGEFDDACASAPSSTDVKGQDSDNDNALPGRLIAAIVVPIFVALVLAIGVFFRMRSRRRRRRELALGQQEKGPSLAGVADDRPGLWPKPSQSFPQELSGHRPSEFPGYHLTELQG